MNAAKEARSFRVHLAWDWSYSAHGDRLHHVARFDDDDKTIAQEWRSRGVSSCGIATTWFIPGFLSRMSMPRCKRCCAATGMPQGDGSPKNDNACRDLVRVTPEEVES